MQTRRRNARFTIMAAGSAGCGKSTLFNNLVGRKIITSKMQSEIDVYMLSLEGTGISQNIVFIDTPGFRMGINDENIQDSIVDYLKEQFDLYIEEESKIRRNPMHEDTRVHCLLYLIPATSTGLRQSDISFLRKVSPLVNTVPVISKADALTEDEKEEMRLRIKEQLMHYEISTFTFDDPELLMDQPINTCPMPFTTICSSNPSISTSTRSHFAGNIQLDDPKNSDLTTLRETILGPGMELLVDVTVTEVYEKYRSAVLESALNSQ